MSNIRNTERRELETFPVLYSPLETNFGHNGLGMLHQLISGYATEKRNGPLTLELTYPKAGIHYNNIEKNSFIKTFYNPVDERHLFRVNEIELNEEEGELNITASSNTDDLNGTFLKSCSVADVDAQTALNELKRSLVEPTKFQFISDITTRASSSWENSSMLAAISGEEGLLLIFGVVKSSVVILRCGYIVEEVSIM